MNKYQNLGLASIVFACFTALLLILNGYFKNQNRQSMLGGVAKNIGTFSGGLSGLFMNWGFDLSILSLFISIILIGIAFVLVDNLGLESYNSEEAMATYGRMPGSCNCAHPYSADGPHYGCCNKGKYSEFYEGYNSESENKKHIDLMKEKGVKIAGMDWCGFTKKFYDELGGKDLLEKNNLILSENDHDKYNIKGFPTLVQENTNEIIPGYKKKEKLIEILEKM